MFLCIGQYCSIHLIGDAPATLLTMILIKIKKGLLNLEVYRKLNYNHFPSYEKTS